MKNLYYFFIIIAFSFAALISGCSEDLQGDQTPPGQITNVLFTPNYGGGYFTFDIPADEDFLYVRAEYTIDTGENISKTSSVYSDTLWIEGFGQEKEYEIKLFSVDRNNNQSQPVIQKITPLAPTTSAILATLEVKPGFSSIVADWENTMEQPVTIYVKVKVGETEVTKIFASNLAVDRFSIENLKGVPYQVSVFIRDSYANQTDTKDFGEVTPLTDGPISKKQWSFLRDQLLYGNKWDYDSSPDPFQQKPFKEFQGTYRDDSLKNARMSYYEGRIEKFYDNLYDYEPVQNLNYFHTGNQTYPFSYFLDMGREIKASRFKIWQREAWGQLYGGANIQRWELWISDDKDPTDGIFDGWEYVGTYELVKPSSVIEQKNQARNGHEYMLYPKNPHFTKPFRYLRYKPVKRINNGLESCASEITLYGTEADGSIIEDPSVLTKAIPGWE
ncbi:MAG: DUF4959 domain-containing protein [Porphyromonadaceae bacterium]|nr:DUF4959 domain-containing protein [Porphyromonadaceae bacterium]